MLNFKRYYLRPNSYDYLALNKVLITYDANMGICKKSRKTAGDILLHPVTVTEATL